MPDLIPITPAEVAGVTTALAHLGGPLDPTAEEALRLLLDKRNVILYGPPGTGKTRSALQIREQWCALHGIESVVLTTFHPSYSYEDFVEGWRPDPTAEGGFDLKDGVFLHAIDLATAENAPPILLLIDEINRGDVARIFGELITFIEHDKRDISFTTAQNRDEERFVPANLFVLGTMNTADKSINLLDVALRRRFAFIPCPPDPAVLASSPEWLHTIGGVDLSALLSAINDRLQEHDIEVDRQVGHALLGVPAATPDPERALIDRLHYDILPLVEEYLYADRDAVREVLPGFLDDDGRPVVPTIDTIQGLLPAAGPAAAGQLGDPPDASETEDEDDPGDDDLTDDAAADDS